MMPTKTGNTVSTVVLFLHVFWEETAEDSTDRLGYISTCVDDEVRQQIRSYWSSGYLQILKREVNFFSNIIRQYVEGVQNLSFNRI